jgi:hypothetical protein
MSTLTVTPYSLTFNTLIRVQVSASNLQGEGELSDFNTEGALVQQKPDTPSAPVWRVDDECTVTTITVEMPRITDLSDEAGGAEITSYNLEYNNGEGSVFYEIAGETTE